MAPAAATPAFGTAVAESIGTSGERLTRSEAFDLVRRSVESLVQGEETTSASAVRQRAFETLGRDSESLSSRNFERVLQDAHDAGMVDLRRRGNDFEVARAADAPEIVEQLKSADNAIKAAAALNAPPAPPRGMSHRGVAPRGGGRGRALGAPSADLLMVGMVPRTGAAAAATPASTPAPASPAAAEAPAPIPPALADVMEAPGADQGAVSVDRTPAAAEPAPSGGSNAPARRGRAPAKAAKTPAKKAAKAPAKAARGGAKSAGQAPAPVVAKKAAKAPAKKAAKAAAKR
jgi:hypothetical protein